MTPAPPPISDAALSSLVIAKLGVLWRRGPGTPAGPTPDWLVAAAGNLSYEQEMQRYTKHAEDAPQHLPQLQRLFKELDLSVAKYALEHPYKGLPHVTPGDVAKYHLGSVLNGGGTWPAGKNSTANDWLEMADAYHRASLDTSDGGAGIPIIWGTDAVHGHNNVIGATLFPHNIALGASNNVDLIKKIGEATAREVAVTGLDWIFAPTVAVAKDNRWGRTYESYSDDSDIVRRYAEAMVLGLQGAGDVSSDTRLHMIATAKHFIGDGGTFRGVDQGDTRLDLETLMELHGAGYLSAIDAGVQTIMASFNSWNGDKVHGNRRLLTDLLKGELGFDGFVIGDWNGHGQVEGCSDDACAAAINAGVDMIMVPEKWRSFLIAKVAPQLMKYKKAIKKLALVGDPRLSACVKAYERTHDSADLVESVEMIAAGMDFNVSPMY